jgi:hypothetical protein
VLFHKHFYFYVKHRPDLERWPFLKLNVSFFLLTILIAYTFAAVSEAQATTEPFRLTPTEKHHIVRLNSNQPYIAGYDVITPNLFTMQPASAIAITVCFMSADPAHFPSDGWLGAGMFVQDQDSHFVHVDYAFYIILALDATDNLFFDAGLHQTRESSAPIQMATEDLLYSYTWQISGIDRTTPVTLGASWDPAGSVHYSVLANGLNVTLPPVNVAGLPDCANIHRQFWAGDFRAGAFPFGHYVHFFQFGVVSPTIIADNNWSVKLSDPHLMNKPGNEWRTVETAYSTQGEISYLDWDWMWGGAPYYGVSAHYYQNPLKNPYEVIFFYNGQTLHPGTVLWQNQTSTHIDADYGLSVLLKPAFTAKDAHLFLFELIIAIGVVVPATVFSRFKGKSTNMQLWADNRRVSSRKSL